MENQTQQNNTDFLQKQLEFQQQFLQQNRQKFQLQQLINQLELHQKQRQEAHYSELEKLSILEGQYLSHIPECLKDIKISTLQDKYNYDLENAYTDKENDTLNELLDKFSHQQSNSVNVNNVNSFTKNTKKWECQSDSGAISYQNKENFEGIQKSQNAQSFSTYKQFQQQCQQKKTPLKKIRTPMKHNTNAIKSFKKIQSASQQKSRVNMSLNKSGSKRKRDEQQNTLNNQFSGLKIDQKNKNNYSWWKY